MCLKRRPLSRGPGRRDAGSVRRGKSFRKLEQILAKRGAMFLLCSLQPPLREHRFVRSSRPHRVGRRPPPANSGGHCAHGERRSACGVGGERRRARRALHEPENSRASLWKDGFRARGLRSGGRQRRRRCPPILWRAGPAEEVCARSQVPRQGVVNIQFRPGIEGLRGRASCALGLRRRGGRKRRRSPEISPARC